MKNISPELQAHLDSGSTTMVYCWRIVRTDGVSLGFTEHDEDLEFGGVVYSATSGFTASAFQSSLGLAVDNLEAMGALLEKDQGIVSHEKITEEDLANGKYDSAKVDLFWVNWQDPSQRILLSGGNVGEIERTEHSYKTEMRSKSHRLGAHTGRTYKRTCDAILGDERCAVKPANFVPVEAKITSVYDNNRRFTVDFSGESYYANDSRKLNYSPAVIGFRPRGFGAQVAVGVIPLVGSFAGYLSDGTPAIGPGEEARHERLPRTRYKEDRIYRLIGNLTISQAVRDLNIPLRLRESGFTSEFPTIKEYPAPLPANLPINVFIDATKSNSFSWSPNIFFPGSTNAIDTGVSWSGDIWYGGSAVQRLGQFGQGYANVKVNKEGEEERIVKIEIKTHEVTETGENFIEFWIPPDFQLTVGMELTLYPGCDKSFDTCIYKFQNEANFQGFPHMPGNDALSRFAIKDEENDGLSIFDKTD